MDFRKTKALAFDLTIQGHVHHRRSIQTSQLNTMGEKPRIDIAIDVTAMGSSQLIYLLVRRAVFKFINSV